MRRAALATLLALSLLPAPPAAAQRRGAIPAHPSQLRFPELDFRVPDAAPHRHQLTNGVVVYVVEDHSLPLVKVAVALPAGEYLDPPGKVGLASLTAAMLRRGGAGELGPDAFDERADRLALEVDAGAGGTRAGASLDCGRWVLGEALDLFFAMLRRPRFDPGRLELAKDNLLENMQHRNDDPLAVAEREWRWLLYGGEHFSVRQLAPGPLAAIGREDLEAFHRRYWQPAGMVVAVSGDVETAAILAELEERFAGWEAGEPAPWPPPAPRHTPRPGLYHVERDIPQGKVLLGHLGAVRDGWDDPDFYTLAVLSELMGGGVVSRIGGRLRTVEGLAYRAGASLGVGDLWPGELRIFIEAESENVALAIQLALEEVERLRRRPPSREELDLVKGAITDAFPLLFDSAEERAGTFAEDEYLGRPHSFWQRYRQRIEAVTPEGVRAMAERSLRPREMVMLVVGRWAEMEGGDRRGRANMGQLTDGSVFHLPARDPLTLEPAP